MSLPGTKNAAIDSYAGRRRETPSGGEEIYIKSHAALTAKTVYKISYGANGPVTAALADAAILEEVVVPEVAVASGEFFWGKTRGPIVGLVVPNDTYLVLEGLKIHDGAPVGTNAAYAYTGAEFAYVTAVVTVATAVANVYLLGREILATT